MSVVVRLGRPLDRDAVDVYVYQYTDQGNTFYRVGDTWKAMPEGGIAEPYATFPSQIGVALSEAISAEARQAEQTLDSERALRERADLEASKLKVDLQAAVTRGDKQLDMADRILKLLEHQGERW